MRLGKTAGPDGEWVVVERDGTAYRTGFRSLRDALSGGVVESPDAAFVEEIAVQSAEVLLPPIDASSKVICVGHNYRDHILEMGHALPDHPNVFSKFPEAVVGPRAPIVLDPAATSWDWEAELALVVGRTARRVDTAEAAAAIAGYTVANDVSARDWQRRTSQWLLGKTFERTTPLGPWLVVGRELDPRDGLTVSCSVNGVEKQRASTKDLVFAADDLVAYLSTVVTLNPGDVVLTGTPGGVGSARSPQEWLAPGDELTTAITGLGELTNLCVAEAPR